MLENLHVRNLTVFPEANLQFSKNLNIIIGENSTGKSHLLKIAYGALSTSWEGNRKAKGSSPTKTLIQTHLAEKLVNIFRPASLGRLTRRKQGRERCEVKLTFSNSQFDFAFSFASNSKTEVSMEQVPQSWLNAPSVYLPTRELLTLSPNFVAFYEGHYLEFEETWRDTCLLLGAPLYRGIKEKQIQELLKPLKLAMGGSVELDTHGRFYLNQGASRGRFEMSLVAEGQRKLAMLARLVATGVLLEQGVLFWDEPEANLNPRLLRQVAESLIHLSHGGVQVFLATHSLFLLREIEILMAHGYDRKIEPRFFGLHFSEGGVVVEQGDSIDQVGNIATLDENLAQTDRFLDADH